MVELEPRGRAGRDAALPGELLVLRAGHNLLIDRARLARPDLLAVGASALLTLVFVQLVERLGTTPGVTLIVGTFLFLLLVAGFVAVPHVMVAGTVAFFIVLPTLEVFVSDLLGATKDVITLAALVAAVILLVQRRASRELWAVDGVILFLAVFVFALYLANIGGNLAGTTGYGVAWFHGVRLFGEPLALLLVGLSLRQPQRCFRWATRSLVVAGVGVALFGLVQQRLGWARLLEMGYVYGDQIRTIGPHLRSFGTLPEPFAYASVLLMALAVLLLSVRWRPVAVVAIVIVALGLGASYVRTAAVTSAALLGLALARRGHVRFAVLVVTAAAVVAALYFVSSVEAPTTRSVRVSQTRYLTLNGRTSVWRRAVGGSPAKWVFGKGVGTEGTASQRATEKLIRRPSARNSQPTGGTVVDSGYLVSIADVGFVGLALLLGLLGRLVFVARRAAARDDEVGWVALGILMVMLIDALTRESFTAFPTAYIAMLLIGLACATLTLGRQAPEPAVGALAGPRG